MASSPEPREDTVTIWDLDEFVEILSDPRVRVVDFDQCEYGAETAKPTRLVGFNVEIAHLKAECTHAPQWWPYTDLRGRERWHWGAHVPLAGRSRDGEYATEDAARYPPALNGAIASVLAGNR